MNEIRAAAERVVARLLDDYSSQDDYDARPGGSRDPYRQTTTNLKFGKKDFTGKRPATAGDPAEADDDEKEEKDAPNRFKLKFEGKGAPVAKSPGGVERKKASGSAPSSGKLKGVAGKTKPTIAKAPGKIQHEASAAYRFLMAKSLPPYNPAQAIQDAEVAESRAKKMLKKKAIAKAPGGVKYGKK